MDIKLFGRKANADGDPEDQRKRGRREPDVPSSLGRGCFGIVAQIGVWAVSAALVTVGAVVFLFGALDFSEGVRLTTMVAIVVAPIGIALLLIVGRAILKDMSDNQDKR